MRTPDLLRNNPLSKAYESYKAPHERGEGYYSQEHIDELLLASEIVSWDYYRKPEVIRGVGTIRYITTTTRQGYTSGLIAAEPENPYLLEGNVPVIGSSAWFTSHEGGFNKDTVISLAKDGNYVFFKGGEGSYDSPEEILPSSPITLGDSAAGVLAFARDYSRLLNQEGHNIHQTRRITSGASRGGNIALGIALLAPHFGQEVIYANAIAPRFPEKLTLSNTPQLLGQVALEAAQLITLPISIGLKRSIDYALETVDPKINSLSHQVTIGGAIMNGEAGLFADHIEKDQLLDILLMSRDCSSEHAIWKQKFEDHSNVGFSHMKGIHMHIPKKTVQVGMRYRILAVQDLNMYDMNLTQENKRMMLNEVVKRKHMNRRLIGKRSLRIAA